MSEKVKLIIEIPKPMYENVQNGTYCGTLYKELKNGIPLDNDSERAEVQAYFDGEAYGWEEGRKALIDDVKAEIEASMYCDKDTRLVKNANASGLEKAIKILDNIGKAESGLKGWTSEEMLEQIRKENNDNPEDIGCDHND